MLAGHGYYLNLQQLAPVKFTGNISWTIMKIKLGLDVLQYTHTSVYSDHIANILRCQFSSRYFSLLETIKRFFCLFLRMFDFDGIIATDIGHCIS